MKEREANAPRARNGRHQKRVGNIKRIAEWGRDFASRLTPSRKHLSKNTPCIRRNGICKVYIIDVSSRSLGAYERVAFGLSSVPPPAVCICTRVCGCKAERYDQGGDALCKCNEGG